MHRRRVRFRLLVAVAFLLVAGCATEPATFLAPPPIPAAARPAHNLEVFDCSWTLVNEKFFDAKLLDATWVASRVKFRAEAEKAADEPSLYATINRMLSQLKESHLVALLPKSAFEFRTQRIAGVGIRMIQVEGKRVITEIIPGSPAETAGIKPGWLVVSRDGVEIEKAGPSTAVPGTPIKFEFLDLHDLPRTMTLKAAVVTFERREARVVGDGVLLVRFDTFNSAAMSFLSRELKEHRGAPAVIVDLRQNPGGLSGVLRVTLGEFFDHSVEGGNFIRRGGRERVWNSVSFFSARYTGRVVVLLDRSSASSSEIFAHVLQHHHRAVVIGRKSAGAVLGAKFYALPGGGRLEVPEEDYVGLDGKRLEGRGVTPDVNVAAATLADWRATRDPDLAAALTELRKPRSISRN